MTISNVTGSSVVGYFPVESRDKTQPEDDEYSMAQQINVGVCGYTAVLQYTLSVYKVHLHPDTVAQSQY